MKSRRGFTLVELLVVMVIIMILAIFIMPTLGRVKEVMWRIECQSNLRQLTQGYFAYAADNNGWIMSSSTGGVNGAPPWVTTYSVPPTVAQQNASLTNGAMWHYVNNFPSYKCPSGNNFGNVRSYSMNIALNGETSWGAKRFLTLQSVKRPANTFLFIEEYDDRAQNEGSWVLYRTGTAWVDYVPSLHMDGCTLSFCDGSVIYYTYVDRRSALLSHVNSSAWGSAPFYWNPNTLPSPDPTLPLVNGYAQLMAPGAKGFPRSNIDYTFLQNNMGY